ncbi:MAG: endonuclease/exonuclease/phosphatase family protein [Paludibacter sp.]|nr:endonuclease/exonuclease/phosphatase family protein [Paludibacter sp.]
MFGKTILKWIMLASNIVAAFFILMTLVGTFINPDKLFFSAYFALAFPTFVFINIIFVLIWVLGRKWYFLLSLVILMLASTEIGDVFPIHFGKTEDIKPSKSFSLLSYNTMGCGKLEKHTKKRPNEVIQYILNQNADIVCIQEYAISDLDEYLTTKDIYRIFKKYPYKYIHLNSSSLTRHNGIATFSKFPIINKQFVNYESSFNSSIYTDIKIGSDTIRLVNNHLESNRITEQDKAMPLKLKDKFDTENLTDITRHFSRKLGVAYKLRASQADSVAKVIETSPYKVLVCGDFNDVPASYAYTKIKGNLKDVFSETGIGFGFTFEDKFYHFRIDYILYDSDTFIPYDFNTDKVKYSDHYPIQCRIGFNSIDK